MVKFMKAIQTLKNWIGVDNRNGHDRRIKKQRKRKKENRKVQRRRWDGLGFIYVGDTTLFYNTDYFFYARRLGD